MKAFRQLTKAVLMMGVAFLVSRCGQEGGGSFRIVGSNSSPSAALTSLSIADEVTGLADDGIHVFAGTEDPASLKVKVLEIMTSPNADCSSATRVSLNLSASHHDVMASDRPTLAAGDATGAFKCVVLSVDDTVYFSSSVSSGACTRGTELTKDICTSGSMDFPDSSYYSQGAGATEGSCSAANQVIPLYFTTASSNTSSTSGTLTLPPSSGATTTTNGLTLANTIDASAAGKAMTLVYNGSGNVDTAGCTLDTPDISLE